MYVCGGKGALLRSDFCFGGGGQFLSVFFLVLLLSSRTILAAQIARSPFPIDSLCWSADSSFFAVGGSNAVSIYNAKDGRMCITLPVKQIQTIDFLAGKSSLLAVLTQDGTLSTWEPYGTQQSSAAFPMDGEDGSLEKSASAAQSAQTATTR